MTGLGLRCAKVLVKPITIANNTAALFTEMENDIQVQTDKDGRTEKMTHHRGASRATRSPERPWW